MNKKIKWKTVENVNIDIIVAIICVVIFTTTIKVLFGDQIKQAIRYVDMFSISSNSKVVKDIRFNEQTKTIVSYPNYGSRYGNIKIESVDIYLPLYYGDKLSILRNGIGQSSGAYFPGEGGSIICMGHNSKTFLYNLPEVNKDDIIEINTTYGDFTYKVYDTRIINLEEVDELEIQNEKEILMLYTCYPVDTFGDKKERFVVYAYRE